MRKKIATRIIVVVLLVVIGAILTVYGASMYEDGKAERQDALFTNGGKIVAPATSSSTDIFHIIFGTNIIDVSREQLANGIDLANYVNIFNVSYPTQISLANNQLVVSAKIENANGSGIAEIANNNEWRRINPDLSWDRNYNTYAFEITEDVSKTSIPNIIPVLQVIMKNQTTILIGCYVNTPNGQIVATINGGIILYGSDATINSTGTPTIFKHPSKDYPGVYLNPNHVRNYTTFESSTENIVFSTGNPVSEADWKISLGEILGVVGTIVIAIVSIFGGIWISKGKTRRRKEEKEETHSDGTRTEKGKKTNPSKKKLAWSRLLTFVRKLLVKISKSPMKQNTFPKSIRARRTTDSE